jgi:hypothetical protein
MAFIFHASETWRKDISVTFQETDHVVGADSCEPQL